MSDGAIIVLVCVVWPYIWVGAFLGYVHSDYNKQRDCDPPVWAQIAFFIAGGPTAWIAAAVLTPLVWLFGKLTTPHQQPERWDEQSN